MNYTVGKVHKLTGIPVDTVRNYARKGKIDSFKDGTNGYWMYTEKGLKQLIALKKTNG